jgi:hypothetical protein
MLFPRTYSWGTFRGRAVRISKSAFKLYNIFRFKKMKHMYRERRACSRAVQCIVADV